MKKKERFGNISAYAGNIKDYIKQYTKISPERIDVKILEGKSFFAHEFWVIPKGAKMPYKESFQFDWSKFQGKYYFSRACLQCEPSYPLITEFQPNFIQFAEILKQYPKFKGEIIVNEFSELKQIEEILTGNEKLPRNRYSIRLRKMKKGEQYSNSVDLYLINQNNEKSLTAKL